MIFILSYAYTYVKINLLQPLIIDDDSLQNLKDFTDIKQFIEYIRPFYPDIKIKDYSTIEIEQVLYHTFIKLIGRILYSSPENMKQFLKDYLVKFEITNIKQIILSLITGINLAERVKNVNNLVEEYLGHTGFINDLLKSYSLDEIQLHMKETKYYKAVRKGILYFKNTSEIFVLEAFLDQLYYENLIKGVKIYNKKEYIIINLFINSIVEIYNLRIILWGIKNNIDRRLLIQFLVKKYLFLDEQKHKSLLNLETPMDFFLTIEDHLRRVKELKAFKIPIQVNKRYFMLSLEMMYQNYYFRKIKIKFDDIEYSTIFRILEFIIRKEKEIKFTILPNISRLLDDRFFRL